MAKKRGSLVNPSDVEALTQLSDVHEVHVYFSLGEKDFVNFKSQYPGQTLKDKIKQLPAVTLLLADNTEYAQTGKLTLSMVSLIKILVPLQLELASLILLAY